MANTFDPQEQEQLDDLKAFWKRYGNLITWVITAALLAYASWNAWGWYQRDQAAKAGAMYEELDKAAVAGDAERVGRIFNDMKERFPGTTLTQQAGLLAAKLQYDKGQADAAQASLSWVADKAGEDEYRTIARLRLAGLQLDAKQYDAALKTLDAATAKEFAALVADRRGDVLLAQGKQDEARSAYLAAWKAMDTKIDYRRLVEAKLTALAAPPALAAAASGAAK
ncbi:MAG: tetratricopeptide repeat protein [Microbacteriaceae bacterium]|nr:tetratricopeptide repeat protein [Burkholderiaceae bacterium]